MRLRFWLLPPTLLPALLPAEEPIVFNRDIRPILSKNCFACHGPDAAHGQKGKLRLDLAEFALKGGESGKPAIVPGKPEHSQLVARIRSSDPAVIMPPPESHLELKPQEKELLTRWIAQGGEYQGHWAFQTPLSPPVPALADAGDNPIDRFVGERLGKEKMSFSPEADRATLLRRLSLDLTGLPPTPEETREFLADTAPGAYERQVDRLLASPRFGEHMAVAWLDAARYADTNGYSIDGGRHQWLWRDWVIKVFNDNKPYDQFLIEQLAGDLLPDASEQQLVASGFNRNNAVTHEGGTIPEENLVNYVADRVKTTSETFMGLTMACAQCHDHKYDPVSIREYYQFFAFFNTVDDIGLDGDAGTNARPSIEAGSCLSTPLEIERVRADLEKLKAEFNRPVPELQSAWEDAQRRDLSERGKALRLHALKARSATAPNGNPDRIVIEEDGSVTLKNGDYSAYNVLCELPRDAGPVRGLRAVFHGGKNNYLGYGKAKGLENNFVLSTLTVSTSPFPASNVDLNAALPLSRISASASQPGYPPFHILDTTPTNGWAPPTGATTPQHITVTFAEPIDPASTPYLTTELLFNFRDRFSRDRFQLCSPVRFQIFAFTGHDDGSPHPEDITGILLAEASQRTPEQAAALQAYFHETGSEKAPLRHQIANLEERLSVLTEKHPVMVMNTSAKPRKTHVLDRGVYSSPLEEVKPGTPAILPPLVAPEGRDLNRLDLARWMTRPDHPLVARVAVNRTWEAVFGRGLAASSADFGSQSPWPSHPELLDWLAVHFSTSGWDVKALLRLMVTSRTYRQSSDTTPEMLERDPRNDWLGRAPRWRLGAEQVRDQALAVSGLLVERLGGPSVLPYQPGDLWRQISHYGSSPATSQTFVQDHGEKLYRRSLYTYWKRTLPPVNLAVFDAPNREVCTIGRTTTNTPLQALVLLNDPQFVEAARAHATKILRSGLPDDATRLARLFTETTGRSPETGESEILTKALQRERARYEADAAAARAVLAIGESHVPDEFSPAELAAWMQVAGLIHNLSETVTRR